MLGEGSSAFWPRLGAGAIDWLIILAALWLAVLVAALLETDGGAYAAILLLPLLYFGLTWARSGQTLGLRATGLKLVSTSTGEPPSRPRALRRALVAVLTFVASIVPVLAAFGDSSQAAAVISVTLAAASLALVGHLWALVDPRGRSLQDRLFGLAVVRTA